MSKLLHRGYDEWIERCIDSVAQLSTTGARSTETFRNYVRGVKRFVHFLLDARIEVPTPDDLKPIHVGEYSKWLKDSIRTGHHTISTARNLSQTLKGALMVMAEYGHFSGDLKRLFPRGVMANTNHAANLSTAYSESEFAKIVRAARDELVDLHHGRIQLYPSEVMSMHLLPILLRTGANLTPMLKAPRDGLEDGLLPGLKRLRLTKKRGHKVLQVALSEGERGDEAVHLPMDGVAVLRRALELSEKLVDGASPKISGRIWLYRTMKTQEFGTVRCLTGTAFSRCLAEFAKRRRLLADDGLALQVSARRIRQTFAARVLRLSGTDVVITSALLGNSPNVADRDYTGLDAQLRLRAGKVFERELADRLRGRVIPISKETLDPETATPTGRCTNSRHGELAPSDGSHCTLFTHCLFCKSFAIVGDVDDLWRLFSFQEYAKGELVMLHVASDPVIREKLRVMYAAAIAFIDRFVDESFTKRVVRLARKRTSEGMHPFWVHERNRARLLRASRGFPDELA